MLSSIDIANLLKDNPIENADPLVIAPVPELEEMSSDNSASVDLRLGTWFLTTKARRTPFLNIDDKKEYFSADSCLTEKYYVPFGKNFILHPNSFVLAVTLEWLRIPSQYAGVVAGKSSWGRRGLIVETAPGIHPGFTGCLTLEMTNLGGVPIAISPGMKICQLFIHKLNSPRSQPSKGKFIGQRKPSLGSICPDEYAKNLLSNDSTRID